MYSRLYAGDNLAILRRIEGGTVDLVYLDPPFNSKRIYKGAGKSPKAKFSDFWDWEAERAKTPPELLDSDLGDFIRIARRMHSDGMAAYALFMAPRLAELHRVLKPTGSLYLHCDSTASHYLKPILDLLFGEGNFRNEIIWQRTKGCKTSTKQLARNTDTILFYAKSPAAKFNQPYGAYNEDYIRKAYRHDDGDGRGRYRIDNLSAPSHSPTLIFDYKGYKPPAKGWAFNPAGMRRLDDDGRLAFPKKITGRIGRKKYLSEYRGTPASNNWTDIMALQGANKEYIGYPTQKPVELLRRIIGASSAEGDLVLDPFCGAGTTGVAAVELGRRFIGMDISAEAVRIAQSRLDTGK